MVRGNPTTVQERIGDHADYLFDLDWVQATGEETINFNVDPDDLEDLETFMNLHDYELWADYGTSIDEYQDVSFRKQ